MSKLVYQVLFSTLHVGDMVKEIVTGNVGIVTDMTVRIDGELHHWNSWMPASYTRREPYRVVVSRLDYSLYAKKYELSESSLEIMYYGALSQYIDRGEI